MPAAAAKSLQSCPTLCDPIDSSPPGSPFPGILQARTLEWVAISCSSAWKWKVKVKSLSRVRPLAWTAAYQAPPSMGFSRQEYWSGVPLPSPLICQWWVILGLLLRHAFWLPKPYVQLSTQQSHLDLQAWPFFKKQWLHHPYISTNQTLSLDIIFLSLSTFILPFCDHPATRGQIPSFDRLIELCSFA